VWGWLCWPYWCDSELNLSWSAVWWGNCSQWVSVSGHSYCTRSLNLDEQLLSAAAVGNLEETSWQTTQGYHIYSLSMHEEIIPFSLSLFILLVYIHISCKNTNHTNKWDLVMWSLRSWISMPDISSQDWLGPVHIFLHAFPLPHLWQSKTCSYCASHHPTPRSSTVCPKGTPTSHRAPSTLPQGAEAMKVKAQMAVSATTVMHRSEYSLWMCCVEAIMWGYTGVVSRRCRL
jgi:hypothetical protein